jgi:Rrf2 family iron-sulfur cluster assembly transcriptional regulator
MNGTSMKLSSQEEFGLRCLLRLARRGEGGSLTIPEISEAEGISTSHAAKLMRLLRRGGFVTSARGQAGGYTLSRPPEKILIGEVLALLGGRLFDPAFCDTHSGVETVCTHTVDCSIRSLWRAVQVVVDRVLNGTTLKELTANEQSVDAWVAPLVRVVVDPTPLHGTHQADGRT